MAPEQAYAQIILVQKTAEQSSLRHFLSPSGRCRIQTLDIVHHFTTVLQGTMSIAIINLYHDAKNNYTQHKGLI